MEEISRTFDEMLSAERDGGTTVEPVLVTGSLTPDSSP